jgi:MFS family permease
VSRDYRLLWTGQAISGIGRQVTMVALPVQVFLLTGSTLAVGGIALMQLIGILLFSLGGGAIADAMDRRRLLIYTQFGLAGCSLALVLLALAGSPPLLALYAVAFASAAVGSIDMPTRSSAVPRLVEPDQLPAAIALGQLNFQVGSVVGPALGGVLVATVGVAGAYALDVASYGASLAAAVLIRPLPPVGGPSRPTIEAVKEGLRFAGGRRIILSTFVIDLNAMIFGMPTSLFPQLSFDIFKAGATGVGLLAAAPAVGALIGALLSGWVSSVRRTGRATIIAVGFWGAAIAAFGLSAVWVSPVSLPFALLFLAIAGGADVLSAVFRSTILQLETPDELRGRLNALHGLVVTGGPRIGDMEAAGVAAVVGPQLSVISGGLLCLLGLVGVVRAYPELADYQSPIAAPAARVATSANPK